MQTKEVNFAEQDAQAVGFPIFFVAATLWMIPTMRWRPIRMDYSLFLRAAEGMLEVAGADAGLTNGERRLAKGELLRFARFLGERWLINNFRWTAEGLMLRLPGVRRPFLAGVVDIVPFFTRRSSHLTLHWDGQITACCSDADERALLGLAGLEIPPRSELEQQVTTALGVAWQVFHNGQTAAASKALGETPEADVFVVPPHKSEAARALRWVLIGCAVLLLLTLALGRIFHTLSGL